MAQSPEDIHAENTAGIGPARLGCCTSLKIGATKKCTAMVTVLSFEEDKLEIKLLD